VDWDYALKRMNPRGVCFKTIKKQVCSEVATFLFCFLPVVKASFPTVLKANSLFCCVNNFSVDWDYALKRMNPRGVCFKTIKKQVCSEVATFLFCFLPLVKASFPTVLKAKKPAFRLAF